MAAAPLRFHGVGINTNRPTKVQLVLFTEKGTPRDVDLSRDDLVKMIAQASRTLARLDGVRF